MAERVRLLLAWAALLFGLPLAALGALLDANKYEGALWLSALDCDGPLKVCLFAVPALLLYGAGLGLSVRSSRRPRCLLVALACALICAALTVNLARALDTARVQAAACDAR